MVGRRVGGADAVTEIICAVVAPTEAARAKHAEVPAQLETAIEAEVTACIQILAAYKRPTRILLAPKFLPKTRNGDIDRFEIRAWFDAADQGEGPLASGGHYGSSGPNEPDEKDQSHEEQPTND